MSPAVLVLINDRLDSLDLEGALPMLPPFRREQALRFRRDTDRRQSVAVWLLLREACRRELGREDVPAVAWTDHGKPYFPDLPDVHFNLSHCTEAAVCALGNEPVGIDVEVPQNISPELMERLMSPGEREQILSDPCPEVALARVWTMKESLLKLTGEGLREDLDTLLDGREDVCWQTVCDPSGRYVYTTATYC